LFGSDKKVPAPGSVPTYVGKGMRIEGKIWGTRPIWIEGEVRGSVDCDSEVIIGESGKVDATIRASFASKQIEIMSKGRVRGNITNIPGSLVIHDGGIVEGLCSTETAEKMKNLLPQSLPKLLPEETDSSVKEIQTTENKETTVSPQTA
jgi:cytoskeletal protein CcmA (bactofilin family)